MASTYRWRPSTLSKTPPVCWRYLRQLDFFQQLLAEMGFGYLALKKSR